MYIFIIEQLGVKIHLFRSSLFHGTEWHGTTPYNAEWTGLGLGLGLGLGARARALALALSVPRYRVSFRSGPVRSVP